MPFPVADPVELREQYADDANLGARRSIYAYGIHPGALPITALDLADLAGGERVVDVGCGPGTYLAALGKRGHRGQLIAVDFSRGMLATARAHGAPVNADVISLPLRDGVADVVIAAHMLYHARDIRAAIAELRRITRPGGLVLVVLNGINHLRELRPLLNLTGERVTVEGAEPLLHESFDSVTAHVYPNELTIPEVQPVLDYGASFPRTGGLGPEELADEVQRRIDRTGAFRVLAEPGILLCR